MNKWLVRGLAFTALMYGVRLAQSVLMNLMPTHADVITVAVLLLGAPWALLWGWADGHADAKAHPDPDRRDDLAMIWLIAGVIAGALSGVLSVITALIYKGFYAGGLLEELSTFAAFTALIVFVPAMVGVALGRKLLDRKYAKLPVHHHGLAAIEAGEQPAAIGTAPTDVFAAVGAGATAAGATAGSEAPTAVLPSQADTTEINVAGEDTTTEIPTGDEGSDS
ncbi:MAG TPA: B-4DMT family transporter [Mycobacterium sp.]|nr:B-4DMT family transporter [Mycobacterium sp.]